MGLPKGRTNNPAGRPVGSRNRRTVELWERLANHTDPAEYLASVVDDKNADAGLRIAAANGLMPYKYSKRGLTSEPAPLVYVSQPVDLPHATCNEIAHVVANIEYLTGLRATGRLDLDAADRLISDQRILGANLIEAVKLEAEHGPKDQTIRIEGGLPPLPLGEGVSPIIMPELNGHAGPAIEGIAAPVDPKTDPEGPAKP
jgi:hypothetical protein